MNNIGYVCGLARMRFVYDRIYTQSISGTTIYFGYPQQHRDSSWIFERFKDIELRKFLPKVIYLFVENSKWSHLVLAPLILRLKAPLYTVFRVYWVPIFLTISFIKLLSNLSSFYWWVPQLIVSEYFWERTPLHIYPHFFIWILPFIYCSRLFHH